MRTKTTDEELLRSYLLGTLHEEEADPLEDRLLRDDELFELSEAIEADLLAACDRGELAPEERERVLRRLAFSPQGRERFALARSLNAEAQAPAPVLLFLRRITSRPAYQWSALAAVLVAAIGLSWHLEHRPGGHVPPRIPPEQPPVEHKVTPGLPPSPPPAPPPKVARESRPPVERAKPVICQLTLMTLRDGPEPPQRIEVQPDTEVVELQIGLEGGLADLESFRISVQSPKGETLLDKLGVKPKTRRGVRTLVVKLPARGLSAGRYEIETQGTAPGKEPEALSPLSIEVVRSSKR